MDRRQKAVKTIRTTTRDVQLISSEKEQDDDVICDDHVSDAVREDLEKALRSIRPRIQTQSIVGNSNRVKRSNVTNITPILGPTIVSNSVRNITPNEFRNLQEKMAATVETTLLATTNHANTGTRMDDDEIEIIREIPRPRFNATLSGQSTRTYQTAPSTSVSGLFTASTPRVPGLVRIRPPVIHPPQQPTRQSVSDTKKPSSLLIHASPSMIMQNGPNGVVPFTSMRPGRTPSTSFRLENSTKPSLFNGPTGISVWPSNQTKLPVSIYPSGAGIKLNPYASTRYVIGQSNSSLITSSNIVDSGRLIRAKQGRLNDVGPIDDESREFSLTSYYGRSQYTEDMKESDGSCGFFKCPHCEDIFTCNIDFINHVYAYLLHPPSGDDSYRNYKTCHECWREFNDPFQLTDHADKVHEKRVDADTTCYICETAFDGWSFLVNHMRTNHPAGLDMPYHCNLCNGNYRSSLYVDVWNHFVLHHGNSTALLCPLCLTTMVAKMKRTNKHASSSFALDVGPFVAHMNQHGECGSKFACRHCKLRFVSHTDVDKHRAFQHRRSRAYRENTDLYSADFVGLKWDGFRPLSELESNGISLPSRRLQKYDCNSETQFSVADVSCIECGRKMKTRGHFSKRLKCCPHCGFSTRCFSKYQCHVAVEHDSGFETCNFEYNLYPRIREPVITGGSCGCGFTTMLGNELAKHLISCVQSNGSAKIRDTTQSASDSNRIRESLVAQSFVLDSLHLVPTFTIPSTFVHARDTESDVRTEETEQDGRQTHPVDREWSDSLIGSPKRRRLLSPHTATRHSESMDLAVSEEPKCKTGKRSKTSVMSESYAELAMKFEVIGQEMEFVLSRANTFGSLEDTSKYEDTYKAIVDTERNE